MAYVSIVNDVARISVSGEIINTTIKQIKAELEAAYQSGCTKVVFDFIKTTDIESAGITGMYQIRNKVGSNNFCVINPNREIYEALYSAKLNDWIRSDVT